MREVFIILLVFLLTSSGHAQNQSNLPRSVRRSQRMVTERSRRAVTARSRSVVTERSRSVVTERSRSEAPIPKAFTNPVLQGFFPDPSVVRVGEDYYIVNSTFEYFPAIVISHSKDLVNWQQIGHVFSKSEDLDLSYFFDGMGIWAPDISYHDGEFYVFLLPCAIVERPDHQCAWQLHGEVEEYSWSLE